MQSQKEFGRRQTKKGQKDVKPHSRRQDAAAEVQIEMEDEDEDIEKAGDKKRLRVSRACDQCRRRKDKCDGQLPTCLRCSNGNRVCTYDMFTKKRGIPTGYIRSIEILLGLVFRHIEGSDALVSTLLATEHNTSNPKALSNPTGGGIQEAESLADVWRKSMAARQIELLLPTPESHESEDGFSQRLNEKLALASSQLATQIPTLEDTSTPNDNVVSPNEATNPSPFPSNVESDLISSILPTKNPLNLPSNWLQLLDLYFSTTHRWFPICQKQDLLRPAYMLASSNHDGTDTLPTGDRAFLWAVLAYAEHQFERLNLRPSNPPSHAKCSSEEVILAAKSLVSINCQLSEPGHVRALLVLGLLEMGRGCLTPAWAIIGQALYIATDLKIIETTTQISVVDLSTVDEGQKRLARGCFVLDTLISACLGRRPYLRSSDLKSIGTIQLDSIEEWEAWQPIDLLKEDQSYMKPRLPAPGWTSSIFNHFVEMVTLLNDLISSSEVPSMDMVYKVADSLNNWRQQLPPHLQIFKSKEGMPNERKSPQLLNLCLAFVFLSTLLQEIAQNLPPGTPQSLFVGQNDSIDQLFGIVNEHIQQFGPLWMPLTLFEKFRRKSDLLSNHDAAMIDCQTISIVASNDNRDQIAKMSNNDITAACRPLLHQLQGQLPGLESSGLGLDIQAGQASTLSTDPTVQRNQTSNQHQQLGSADARFGLGQDINFSSSGEPLTGGTDDDFLFNSLASLDPVDWTANQPEFMQHLGFTGEFVQSDYQSFFGA